MQSTFIKWKMMFKSYGDRYKNHSTMDGNVGTHNNIVGKNTYLFLLYRVFRIQSLVSVAGTWRMVSIMMTLLLAFVHHVQTTKWKMQPESALRKYSTEISLSLRAWLLFNYGEFSNPTTKKQWRSHGRPSYPLYRMEECDISHTFM